MVSTPSAKRACNTASEPLRVLNSLVGLFSIESTAVFIVDYSSVTQPSEADLTELIYFLRIPLDAL